MRTLQDMFDDTDVTLDCNTCLAANTTACNDCVVSHLLANDDGPIDLVLAPVVPLRTPADRAIELFSKAGLVDDPVEFVSAEEFESIPSRVPSG